MIRLVFNTYADQDGNEYELRPQETPWVNGQRCCKDCAFKIGGTRACVSAPTCTPENKPREFYGVSLRWFQVKWGCVK